MTRRFPPPYQVEQTPGRFKALDASDQLPSLLETPMLELTPEIRRRSRARVQAT